MIIMGIDPGTTTIGFALVEKIGNKIRPIEHWIISTPPKTSLTDRLLSINSDLNELLDIYNPSVMWIEKLFFVRNITNGIDVAQARGVIIHTVASRWIIVNEFAPTEVKKWITGNWAAKKTQVQKAVTMILWLSEIPKPDDAADALAIAYLTALHIR